MKKFLKFIAGTVAVAAAAAGAFYAYKKFFAKDNLGEDDELDDDLDDFELDDDEEDEAPIKTPEYVSINPTESENA